MSNFYIILEPIVGWPMPNHFIASFFISSLFLLILDGFSFIICLCGLLTPVWLSLTFTSASSLKDVIPLLKFCFPLGFSKSCWNLQSASERVRSYNMKLERASMQKVQIIYLSYWLDKSKHYFFELMEQLC